MFLLGEERSARVFIALCYFLAAEPAILTLAADGYYQNSGKRRHLKRQSSVRMDG